MVSRTRKNEFPNKKESQSKTNKILESSDVTYKEKKNESNSLGKVSSSATDVYAQKVSQNNLNRLIKVVEAAEFDPSKRSCPTRALINKKAFHVAEALFLYVRNVDVSKNFELLPNLTELKKKDQSWISRANDFLDEWRKGITTNEIISCADYFDEYECGDMTRKWVKLYKATVLSSANGLANNVEIHLGDSSLKTKKSYCLKDHELAIHVHYEGFGASSKRWLLLTGKNRKFIVPFQSMTKSLIGLERLHKKIDMKKKAAKNNEEKLKENGRTANKRKLNEVNPKRKPDKKVKRKMNEVSSLTQKKNFFECSIDDEKLQTFGDEVSLSSIMLMMKSRKEGSNGIARNNDIMANQKAIIKNKNTKNLSMSKDKNNKVEEACENDSTSMGKDENQGDFICKNEKISLSPKVTKSIHENVVKNEKTIPISPKNTKSSPEYVAENEKKSSSENVVSDVKHNLASKCNKTEKNDFNWICANCREAESVIDPESPLLLCEGPCGRPFHYPCAGLHSLPSMDQIWICTDCIQKRHQCAGCNQYGDDDVDVFKCEKKNCGLFFHEGCLSTYSVEVTSIEVNGETKPRFKCPAHECWTCASHSELMYLQNDAKKKNKNTFSHIFSRKTGDLYRCLECPNAFHISCIPPNARFHELALLCHEHAKSSKLPDLDFTQSMQAEVEAEVDKKLKKLKQGKDFKETKSRHDRSNNPFLPIYVCPLATNDKKSNKTHTPYEYRNPRDFFKVPSDFREAVHAKPATYRHVNSLQYNKTCRPKRYPPNENGICNCTPVTDGSNQIACDEKCLNALIMIECVGDRNSKTTNPYTNCDCGPTCGNRKLSRKEVAQCKVERENGKGWGLMALENVNKGQLVQEYIGEVINEKEMTQRMEAWSNDHPHDTNFYTMHLEAGWFIDAREKGNLSRFINHSCEPNCKLVPVNVAGYMRIAIMSIKDIEAGEFFSYDYQFDTNHADQFVCRCGADNCRGTMRGGSNKNYVADTKPEKKTIAQLKDEGKARFERDRKFLEQCAIDEKSRLNCVGALVPGEPIDGSNTVASGPQEKDKDYVQNHHIFLWRNVLLGANFNSRYNRISNRAKKKSSKPKP